MPSTKQDIAEHQRQIEQNLQHWEQKPFLREIYREFHRLILRYLSALPGETVEVGSGIGNIKEVIPGCVRTDIFANPWIDRQENIYQLSMGENTVANLILFDVFHHLEYPLDALDECRRVLRPGGHLLVFDHAMSAAGFLFSKFVHHERAGFLHSYKLRADNPLRPGASNYYADQANSWRIFERNFNALLQPSWRRVATVRKPAIKWLLSGGYRNKCYVTPWNERAIKIAEQVCSNVPSLFALRLLVVLQKT